MNLDVRRRVYLVGLLIGIPTLPLIWLARAPEDAFLRVSYPALTVFLVAVAWGLWSRRWSVPVVERLVLLVVGAFYLTRLAVAVHATPDLSTVTGELTESTFWNINLLLIFAYLAFETRRALQVCAAIVGAVVVILAARLVPDVLAGVHVAEAVTYLRVTAFLAASTAVLYGLAHVKAQLADARATASAMAALARTDQLTGLANRRALDDELTSRVAEAERYARPVSVLLLDVDAFKAVNDAHGHETGDDVLRGLADVLRRELRTNDTLGRWGGEEFLLVAPETTRAAAEQLAERCRAVVAATPVDRLGRPVTVSIGVATYQPGDLARDLLKRADDALYAAKRGGRDQVCVS